MHISALELAKVQAEIRQLAEDGANIMFPSDATLAEEDVDQIDVLRMLRRCVVRDAYMSEGELVYELLAHVEGLEMGGWVIVARLGKGGHVVVIRIKRVWKNNRGW